MSVQRSINSRFWSDTFVVDKLNPLDRYLFLYFLTNERTNLAGVYEVPLKTISNETGIEKETILNMIGRLKGRVEYKNGWICLVNFIKHQNITNSSIKKGIENKLSELPSEVKVWVNELRKDTDGIPEVYERGTSTDKGKERKGIERKGTKGIGEVYEKSFEDFWKAYPEKKGKGKAYESWKKISSKDKELCLLAIKNQVENFHFRNRSGVDFIPHPTTWLNQRRWEDEVKGRKVQEVVKLTSK